MSVSEHDNGLNISALGETESTPATTKFQDFLLPSALEEISSTQAEACQNSVGQTHVERPDARQATNSCETDLERLDASLASNSCETYLEPLDASQASNSCDRPEGTMVAPMSRPLLSTKIHPQGAKSGLFTLCDPTLTHCMPVTRFLQKLCGQSVMGRCGRSEVSGTSTVAQHHCTNQDFTAAYK